MTTFRVGDTVTAFGVQGVVEYVGQCVDYPIEVRFPKLGGTEAFTGDGRFLLWHAEPSLKLVARAKRKVTKTIERWAVVGRSTGVLATFPSEFEAEEYDCMGHVDIIKLTGSYEVEE